MRAVRGRTYPSRVSILLGAALAVLLAPPPADGHPLSALAARASAEIARLAAGRPVEVDVPVDASGLGSASDLQALIAARLGPVESAASGQRLRVASVLARSASRLQLVGRATLEPDGTLVDVFAVSVDADPQAIAALARPPRGVAATVSLTATAASVPLPGRVLDLVFADDEDLIVLFADAVVLYRGKGAALSVMDRRALAVTAAVRAPAGIVVSTPGESAFWVATNLADGAVLFSIDAGRLHETERAPVFPFPGAPRGARFQPGTDRIAMDLPALGEGPHLRIGAGTVRWAIGGDGRLGFADAGWSDLRVGSAAAELWPGTMATTSALAPGAGDAITIRDTRPMTVLMTIPVTGAITAMAARAGERVAVVAAAVEDGGIDRLVFLELARAE